MRQAAAPHDLTTAADTLELVIRADRDLAGKLQLAARANRAEARAAATLSQIRQTDQRALMSPLRTGVPGAKRALARHACAAAGGVPGVGTCATPPSGSPGVQQR